MKRIVALLFAGMLCACVSGQKEDVLGPSLKKWIGRSADDLVLKYGVPSDGYMLDSGARVYEYYQEVIAPDSKGLEKKVRGMHYVPNGIAGSMGDLVPDDEVALNAGLRPKVHNTKNKNCMILFTVASNNIIESWSKEGDGCD